MKRIQVITGAERRRRFSLEEKKQILAEAAAPNSSVSAVARKYEISPSLIYIWRKSLTKRRPEALLPLNQTLTKNPFVRVMTAPLGLEEATASIRVRVGDNVLLEFPGIMDMSRLASFVNALRG